MEDKLKQEIILDEKCGKEIITTFNLFSICISVYSVWLLFSVYKQIIEIFIKELSDNQKVNVIIEYKIIPIAYLFQAIFSLVGVLYQYRSFKMQRNAVINVDSKLFTLSYLQLRRGLIASLIAILISISIYFIFKFSGFYTN